MLYYDENKYKKYISEETILKIESELGVQCLFGGAFSSCVHGIDNKASDFDFYLIYDKKKADITSYRYVDKETFTDIAMFDWDYINKTSSMYLDGIKKFPSVLFRSTEKVHRPNVHRPDFASQIIFEILYSDCIWDSGFLVDNIDSILGNLSYLGILDYYFTRAWGNFQNELAKEKGRAVKYLMTFLGYACMRWLIEYKTIPNMDICFMFNQYMPERFADFYNVVLKKQKSLDVDRDFRMHIHDVSTHIFEVDANVSDASKPLKEKPEVYIERNEELNIWVNQELHTIAGILKTIAASGEKVCIQGGDTAFLFKNYIKTLKL